jgi:hypothetical protein
MPDDNTRAIVDFAYDENGKDFRDALYASIHDRVSAHINAKKQEIAQSLIAQPEEPVEPEVVDQIEITADENA